MKILVLGANGLIGSTLFKVLSEDSNYDVYGTIRSDVNATFFVDDLRERLLYGIQAQDTSSQITLFSEIKPSVVINCIGATKHKKEGNDPIQAIELNSLFPHRLSQLCELIGARLIHISTDCVFSGSKGNYHESDSPDAVDIYGKSKALGEVVYGNSLTLRTSTIGHEINSSHGLLDWFLKQSNGCKGYKKAVFSGLPTVSLAQVIKDFVLPKKDLSGLYHVAALPINKYDLLNLIANIYNKNIDISVDEDFQIDRSLNAEKFNHATGYEPPNWDFLIRSMYEYQNNRRV